MYSFREQQFHNKKFILMYKLCSLGVVWIIRCTAVVKQFSNCIVLQLHKNKNTDKKKRNLISYSFQSLVLKKYSD